MRGTGTVQQMDPEYAKLMGITATQGKSAMPGPLDVGAKLWEHLQRPFYDNGPNDKGVGIQLGYSIARVAAGLSARRDGRDPDRIPDRHVAAVLERALDPFIQVLKPISPLAWMPLALYTIKDSGLSAIFVIFICSLWPMLINTAFGVAAVRKEWLNVARTLEVGTLRRAFTIILPAAAPTILTGMRISIGIAWLVIVAAEMLVGGTGIGYFVWNEWNNLINHKCDYCDFAHRDCRDAARPDARARDAARDVSGVSVTDRFISIEGIAKRYPAPTARPRSSRTCGSTDAARRVHLRDRPFGLRQDHRAQHPRRPRSARPRAP